MDGFDGSNYCINVKLRQNTHYTTQGSGTNEIECGYLGDSQNKCVENIIEHMKKSNLKSIRIISHASEKDHHSQTTSIPCDDLKKLVDSLNNDCPDIKFLQ